MKTVKFLDVWYLAPASRPFIKFVQIMLWGSKLAKPRGRGVTRWNMGTKKERILFLWNHKVQSFDI